MRKFVGEERPAVVSGSVVLLRIPGAGLMHHGRHFENVIQRLGDVRVDFPGSERSPEHQDERPGIGRIQTGYPSAFLLVTGQKLIPDRITDDMRCGRLASGLWPSSA